MSERVTTRRILLVLVGLGVLGVVSGARIHTAYAYAGKSIPWADALGTGLLDWYLWAPLVPAILLLARRLRPSRIGVVPSLLGHALAGAVASVVQLTFFAAATAAIRAWRFDDGHFLRELRSGVLYKFHTGVLVYGAFVLGLLVLAARREVRESELRRARLDESLARTRLAALRARLQPHFLFNALNSVAAMIQSDPGTAERMVVALGDLLRAAIPREDEDEPTLATELDLVEGYLGIERARYGERLATELRVEPGLERALVPGLLLQPLVENAVRHGVAPRPKGGRVEVDVRRVADRLQVEVTDDGVGSSGAAPAEHDGAVGLGLAATRERLHLLYGDAARLAIEPRVGGGTRVSVVLPLRLASDGRSAEGGAA